MDKQHTIILGPDPIAHIVMIRQKEDGDMWLQCGSDVWKLKAYLGIEGYMIDETVDPISYEDYQRQLINDALDGDRFSSQYS